MKTFLLLLAALLPTLSIASETPSLKAQSPEFLDVALDAVADESAEPVTQKAASPSLERRIEALERFAKDSSRWMQATQESQITEARVREIVTEMIEAKLSILTATGEKRTQVVSYAGEGQVTLNPGERLLSVNGYSVNSSPVTTVTPAVQVRTIRPLLRPRLVLRGLINRAPTCRMVNGVMYCSQ